MPNTSVTGVNSGDGGAERTIRFSSVTIAPCSYVDLVKAVANEPLKIPLKGRNAVISHSDVDGLHPGATVSFDGQLESPFSSRAFGLVPGGWMPPTIPGCDGSMLLIDRNIFTDIVGRFDGGMKKGIKPDFLDLFEDSYVRINPMLLALEGNTRTFPTHMQALAQLDEAVTKLSRAMPKAEIVVSPNSLTGVMGIIDETRAKFQREQALLVEVARTMSGPTPRKKVVEKINRVFELADKHNVRRSASCVFAIISSISVENGRSPATKLLKFNIQYTEKHAYNVLCDLRALDILLQGVGRFPDESILFCTADRSLALLWCGMQTLSSVNSDDHVVVSFDPIEQLLPSEAKAVWRAGIDARPR